MDALSPLNVPPHPLRLGLFPWVESIRGSIERIAELVSGEEIEAEILTQEPDWNKYDGAILNNSYRPLPLPRITYLTGFAVRRTLRNPGYALARIREGDHRGVFTNSNTAALALRGVGVNAQCLYRPYPLQIPQTPPPLPAETRVLWYWKPGWAYCEDMDEAILDAMWQVAEAGIEIWVISNKHAPVSGLPPHPRIRGIGRCSFSETLPQVRGMVRLTGDFDWGRSNFDVISHGRWVLNLNAREFEDPAGPFLQTTSEGPRHYHTMSAETIEQAVELLITLIQQPPLVAATHHYASSHFSEEILRKSWQGMVRNFFSVGT